MGYSKLLFLKTNLRNFLRAPLTPIKSIFKGERASKKKVFWSKFLKRARSPREKPRSAPGVINCKKFYSLFLSFFQYQQFLALEFIESYLCRRCLFITKIGMYLHYTIKNTICSHITHL